VPKRCIVFFDGQNLYHGARDAWAPDKSLNLQTHYSWPSYDVEQLAEALVASESGRVLSQARFYTGVPGPSYGKPPSQSRNDFWHKFWNNKLRHLAARGVHVYRGRINPGGQEKGVDVSIAIDLIRLTYEQAYDVAILVSSDSDLGPAVRLAKGLCSAQGRMCSFESAFPYEEPHHAPRGVPGTVCRRISRGTYDACRDPREYRARRTAGP
jgi:uncharacterized LabA/DUF88 family protein